VPRILIVVGYLAQRYNVGLWPADFPVLLSTCSCRSAKQANSAFHPFGVDK